MVQAMKLSAMPALILVLLWLCFFVCFVLFLVLDSMTVLCWKLDLLLLSQQAKKQEDDGTGHEILCHVSCHDT